MNRWRTRGLCGVTALLVVGGFISSVSAEHPDAATRLPEGSNEREAIGRFVDLYCVACHNRDDKTAGLALDAISSEDVSRNPNAWEKVVRKARRSPDAAGGRGAAVGTQVRLVRLSMLAGSLDRAAAEKPEPGRTGAFRRLNRTEYQNAIRDLLALDIDATSVAAER